MEAHIYLFYRIQLVRFSPAQKPDATLVFVEHQHVDLAHIDTGPGLPALQLDGRLNSTSPVQCDVRWNGADMNPSMHLGMSDHKTESETRITSFGQRILLFWLNFRGFGLTRYSDQGTSDIQIGIWIYCFGIAWGA